MVQRRLNFGKSSNGITTAQRIPFAAVASRVTLESGLLPAGGESVSDQPSVRVTEALHGLARVLRESPPPGPEAQRLLANLIDELGNAVGSAEMPAVEVAHLADSTAQFVHALHRRHEPGRLAAARDRLEQSVLQAEARAPVAAGVARRVLDALANLGI
jgi:hypothetical protein